MNKTFSFNRLSAKRGFTLLELMVVVSIIGFLSSASLASLNDIKAKSRNTARITQVRELHTAFQIAFKGVYPNTTALARCLSVTCYGTPPNHTNDPALEAFFDPIIDKPVDPPGGRGGRGGFVFINPNSPAGWPAGALIPRGYYISYTLEWPANEACVLGSTIPFHNAGSPRLECYLPIDK